MGIKENVNEFFKKNSKITKALCLIGFLLSAFYTYLSFVSKSDPGNISIFGVTVSLIALGFTLVWDGCKGIFFVAYEKTRERKYFFAWIIAMIFSIIFSLGYFIIQDNSAINRTNNSKLIYENTKEKKDNIKNQIELKKTLLSDAKTEKSSAATSLSQQKTEISNRVNEYNKNIKLNQSKLDEAQTKLKHSIAKGFYGQQEADKARINQLKNDIASDTKARDSLKESDNTAAAQSKIDQYTADIDQLTEQFNSINPDTLPETKTTSTLVPLFELIPIASVGTCSIIFNLARSTMFELFICYLFNLSCYGTGSVLPPTGGGPGKKKVADRIQEYLDSIKKTPRGNIAGTTALKEDLSPRKPKKYKVKRRIRKTNNVIPLPSPKVNDNQNFTNKDLTKYLDYMYDNTTETKNGIESPGYGLISKADIGLSYKTCRAIHGFLVTTGTITTVGKRTIILKGKKAI